MSEENVAKPKYGEQQAPDATSETTDVSDDTAKTPTSKSDVTDGDPTLGETAQDEVAPDEDIDRLIPQEPYRMSPLFHELAQYFGVDQAQYDAAAPKLSDIIEWAIRETKSNKLEDLLPLIQKTESRLTPPTIGEKRYDVLRRYVRLLSKRSSLDKAIKAYESPWELNNYGSQRREKTEHTSS